MTDKEWQSLLHEASSYRERAQAKYSRFKVGAAILTTDGKLFGGCNVESSSYGLSICAERVALTKALSEGSTGIKAVAVVADTRHPVSPCGACRQLLHDYAPNAQVMLANVVGEQQLTTVGDLLPDAFSDESLPGTGQE